MILDTIPYQGESFELIDATLAQLWRDGATVRAMVMSARQIMDVFHRAEQSGSVVPMKAATAEAGVILGVQITGYRHPVTGEMVSIASRYEPLDDVIQFSDEVRDTGTAWDYEEYRARNPAEQQGGSMPGFQVLTSG
jgi:hypothetical protein